MKRLMMAAAVLCLAGPLAAQGPGRMGPPAGPPTMDELAARLKLTPAQRTEIAPLHASFVKETEPLRATARSEMGAVRSARQAGAPAESVSVHQAKARTAMGQLDERARTWHAQLETKLTEEQKAEWKRWQEERRQEMRERMQGRGGQKPGGPPS
jgi:Spy/CpxP family protein refolding chaperone